MRKFLVVRFSSIGDVVLCTPIVRSLKSAFPSSEIHFLTRQAFVPLLAHNPHIARVWGLQGNLSCVLPELRAEGFSWVLDLHKNLRSLRLKMALAGVPSSSFPKLNLEKYLLVRLKQDIMPAEHIVDRYAKSLAPLGAALDAGGLEVHLPAGLSAWAAEQLRAAQVEPAPLAMALGGTHYTKRYPPDLQARLAASLNQPLLLLGGPQERPEAEAILAHVHRPVLDAVGRFNLLESAALLQRCRAAVANDTGFMHIAAAFGLPVFSIWGNTVPSLGMYPYRTLNRIFEVQGLPCRPCSKIGFAQCPKGHFKCMRNQVPETIAQAISESLKPSAAA